MLDPSLVVVVVFLLKESNDVNFGESSGPRGDIPTYFVRLRFLGSGVDAILLGLLGGSPPLVVLFGVVASKDRNFRDDSGDLFGSGEDTILLGLLRSLLLGFLFIVLSKDLTFGESGSLRSNTSTGLLRPPLLGPPGEDIVLELVALDSALEDMERLLPPLLPSWCVSVLDLFLAPGSRLTRSKDLDGEERLISSFLASFLLDSLFDNGIFPLMGFFLDLPEGLLCAVAPSRCLCLVQLSFSGILTPLVLLGDGVSSMFEGS
jgi:hypothetical protein